MPILCSRASVSLRLRSKSESSGVDSLFCWLSDCSGYRAKKCQFTHHDLRSKLSKHMHVHEHFDRKFQHQPSAHTQMIVCTHGHTQPQPFMCHGLTESNRTHKQCTPECDTVWVPVVWMLLTFFLTSFFFLSSSFIFFSCLIWARRCFLRSSSAFRSLLSDMLSYRASGKGTNRNEQHRALLQYALVSC